MHGTRNLPSKRQESVAFLLAVNNWTSHKQQRATHALEEFLRERTLQRIRFSLIRRSLDLCYGLTNFSAATPVGPNFISKKKEARAGSSNVEKYLFEDPRHHSRRIARLSIESNGCDCGWPTKYSIDLSSFCRLLDKYINEELGFLVGWKRLELELTGVSCLARLRLRSGPTNGDYNGGKRYIRSCLQSFEGESVRYTLVVGFV
ncbi:hypothetical protein R1flu_014593 [Riccia fluitans]|uniref:Uncharacterized protein n=1 Tax=Riccia fluitans TaxID=41844 RepID=A0ABD1YJN0_9MARC